MSTLEMKMEAVLEMLTAEDETEREAARKKILRLMESSNAVVKKEDPETMLRQILLELGAPDHLLGHPYVIQAVLLALQDRMYINNITFGLYPQLAARFDTTAARVERAIRHLIDVTWSRGDVDALNRYFGNTVSAEKGRPTNGEFIARLANAVKLRMSSKEDSMAKLFTEEELEELRRADEEIDKDFSLTQEDLDFSRRMDREVQLDRLDNRSRRIAEYQAAYYEANKEKIAAQKAAYYEANREKWSAYQREYRRRKREEKKNTASRCARPESGLGQSTTYILRL